jgi:hypothetical protein
MDCRDTEFHWVPIVGHVLLKVTELLAVPKKPLFLLQLSMDWIVKVQMIFAPL